MGDAEDGELVRQFLVAREEELLEGVGGAVLGLGAGACAGRSGEFVFVVAGCEFDGLFEYVSSECRSCDWKMDAP